jgi:hypothetical protein
VQVFYLILLYFFKLTQPFLQNAKFSVGKTGEHSGQLILSCGTGKSRINDVLFYAKNIISSK